MVPSPEVNGDNLGIFLFNFLYNNCMEYTHKNHLDEAFLMSTHNIQFHDKIRKNH